jgi:transcriptional regulator with XRE-family HTH domain
MHQEPCREMRRQGKILPMAKTKKPKAKSPRRRTFIREWRKHRKLTQEELAEEVHLSQEQVSRIEKGEQPYTQETLEAFAAALKCSPADLIMRGPDETQPIWAILEKLSPADREAAAKMLQILADRAA